MRYGNTKHKVKILMIDHVERKGKYEVLMIAYHIIGWELTVEIYNVIFL